MQCNRNDTHAGSTPRPSGADSRLTDGLAFSQIATYRLPHSTHREMWVSRVAFHCKTIPFGLPSDRCAAECGWPKKNNHHMSPTHHEQNRTISGPPADQTVSLQNDPKRILAVLILTRGTLRAQKPKWGIYSCNKSPGSVIHIRRETYACYYLLSRQRDSRVAPFSAPVTKMDICWNAYSSIDQHFAARCI